MAFSLKLSVTLATDICILMSTSYHLAGLVSPLWHLGGHFGRLRALWWTIGAAGRTRGVWNQSFIDFGGLHLNIPLKSDGLDSIFVWACFQVAFQTEFLIEILTVRGLETRLRQEIIAKTMFPQK